MPNETIMKRLTLCIAIATLLLSAMPVTFAAQRTPITVPTSLPIGPVEAQILIDRLNEIKQTNKHGMSAEERKALRQEKKAIKQELRSGGVYISVGVLLVVVILLILLL